MLCARTNFHIHTYSCKYEISISIRAHRNSAYFQLTLFLLQRCNGIAFWKYHRVCHLLNEKPKCRQHLLLWSSSIAAQDSKYPNICIDGIPVDEQCEEWATWRPICLYLPHIFISPILFAVEEEGRDGERASITIRQQHKHLNKIRFGNGMVSPMLDNDAACFWFWWSSHVRT